MKAPKHSAIIQLPRVTQKTDSYCGPAVLEMLYAHQGKTFSQDEVVTAARLGKSIQKKGSRPRQLANAVKKLTPNLQYWFKQEATIDDLHTLVNEYHLPVGINWQGLFYDKVEDEPQSSRSDKGHYSVVVGINRKKDQIVIQDPYRFYSAQNRVFSLSWFVTRWMDRVREKNQRTGKFETTRTKHFLFILAPKTAKLAKELNLLPPQKLSILKSS
jgi:ABC-type bacteriocin/lantibiotic exporter with double-glycine peptidase domain